MAKINKIETKNNFVSKKPIKLKSTKKLTTN